MLWSGWGNDNSIRWLLTHVYNLQDQNEFTLPITSKANSNRVLSECKELQFSQKNKWTCVWKAALVFDCVSLLCSQRREQIFEPPFCSYHFKRLSLLLALSHWSTSNFLLKATAKSLSNLPSSLLFFMQSKYILEYVFQDGSPDLSLLLVLSLLSALPNPSDLLTKGG